jgi:argininosuccinate lyase
MSRKALLDYAGSSEAHDRLVFDFGVPFRTGHRVLGTMVRNHYMGEPRIDLKAILKAETGRDIDIDQDEIFDIVLGKRIWPTTFDPKMLQETLTRYRGLTAAAEAKFSGPSVIESAIDRLVDEARAWLSKNSTPA